MSVFVLPRSLRTVVVTAGTVVVAAGGAAVGADAIDFRLPSTHPPDVAVAIHVPHTMAESIPQGPTLDEIAEAQRWWHDDVEVEQGRDSALVHYTYDPDVDLYLIQKLTITWTRHQKDGTNVVVGVFDDSDNAYESYVFEKASFGDRNRDGVPDLLVGRGSGGNCSTCDRPALLQPKDGRLVDLLDLPTLQESRWPLGFVDVDHDGRQELIVVDLENPRGPDGFAYGFKNGKSFQKARLSAPVVLNDG